MSYGWEDYRVPVDVNISDNNAPSPSLKESFTDQGLNGYGSSYNFSSGGGSVSYSLSQDGSVKMVSADVGKVVGGSKKLIGLDIAATGMKILDISQYGIKYDKVKKEYVNNKSWR